MLKQASLWAIRLYQRHLSPHKGFVCAYRVHTGRCSCSALGYRAIRWHGVWAGMRLLLQRTRLCGVAYRRHVRSAAPQAMGMPMVQRGVCDASCDLPCDLPCDGPCHLPHIDWADAACDAAQCCNGCDHPFQRSRDEQERDEREVFLPPRRKPSNGG